MTTSSLSRAAQSAERALAAFEEARPTGVTAELLYGLEAELLLEQGVAEAVKLNGRVETSLFAGPAENLEFRGASEALNFNGRGDRPQNPTCAKLGR